MTSADLRAAYGAAVQLHGRAHGHLKAACWSMCAEPSCTALRRFLVPMLELNKNKKEAGDVADSVVWH